MKINKKWKIIPNFQYFGYFHPKKRISIKNKKIIDLFEGLPLGQTLTLVFLSSQQPIDKYIKNSV